MLTFTFTFTRRRLLQFAPASRSPADLGRKVVPMRGVPRDTFGSVQSALWCQAFDAFTHSLILRLLLIP